MSLSYATVTPGNMELTPVRVKWTPPGGGSAVDLGGTHSNVMISTKYIKAPITADQTGKTTIDRRVAGVEITVTTELAEVLNKDNWKVVFPHAVETLTGTKAIDIKNTIGDGDLSNAGKLVLHPLSMPDTDLSADLVFPLATASAESSIDYGPDKQSVLKIVWNILPDLTSNPPQFYRFGDPAV